MLKMTEVQNTEIIFAQKLSCNDNRVRDRALKKLEKWMGAKTAALNTFSYSEMIKIWKGLYYCMWMSDKPLVQEKLADSIAKLILCFGHLDASYLFLNCAFSTLTREWNGLDRLRVDKFMVLVRRLVRYSFVLMKKNNWDPKVVSSVTEVFNKSIASIDSKVYISVGIKFHFADIYCEELGKVAGGTIDHAVIQLCLEPFINILTKSSDMNYCKHVEQAIFEHLIDQSDVKELAKVTCEVPEDFDEELEDEDVEMGEDVDDEEEEFVDNSLIDKGVPLDPRAGNVGVVVPQLEVDFASLADHIFTVASKSNIRSVNRKLAYAIVKKLKATADELEGNVELELEQPKTKKVRTLPSVRQSVIRLRNFREKLRNMDDDDMEDFDDGDVQPEAKKAKKKRKDKDMKIEKKPLSLKKRKLAFKPKKKKVRSKRR